MVNAIVIFARLPIPGKAKTRLAATLGPETAANLYSAFAINIFKEASRCVGMKLYVACSDPDEKEEFANWLERLEISQHFTLISQVQSDDLGQRMGAAICSAFDDGASRVAVVGSDIPSLTAEHLESAFHILDSHQVVVGPAKDGGYYLLGMTSYRQELFEGIQWSTSSVRKQTLEKCNSLQLHVANENSLPTLQDIDVYQDLLSWIEAAKKQGKTPEEYHVLALIDKTIAAQEAKGYSSS